MQESVRKYFNPRNDFHAVLKDLPPEIEQLYDCALKRFVANSEWMLFHELVFGVASPLNAYLSSINLPLNEAIYLTFKDMWLQLGVQQGKVRAGAT